MQKYSPSVTMVKDFKYTGILRVTLFVRKKKKKKMPVASQKNLWKSSHWLISVHEKLSYKFAEFHKIQ